MANNPLAAECLQQKAVFSPCRRWRYMLSRPCAGAHDRALLVIGLNPSVADEMLDDPTIRRCRALAARQGCGVLLMGNLFAWRATDPRVLRQATYPIGEDNTAWLLTMASCATQVMCAWGNHGKYLCRGDSVAQVLREHGRRLFCLGITKQGQPRHPLYLSNSTAVIPWLAVQEELYAHTP